MAALPSPLMVCVSIVVMLVTLSLPSMHVLPRQVTKQVVVSLTSPSRTGCWLEKAYEKEVETVSNFVPQTDDKFVQFGHFKDIKSIIKSRIFYPLFITGLSGNGKTHSVEQSCAQLSRECVRVNITIETDEDDLIGGFRLKDGETVWSDGPVVEALKRGYSSTG